MKLSFARLLGVALMLAMFPFYSLAGTVSHGPTGYLQAGDAPAGFASACSLTLEDFEDNGLDSFLTMSNGSIITPNSTSGTESLVTDSVDGDDGVMDGSGADGHSWYTGIGRSNDNTVTIDFDSNVHCAGLVFTDGAPISTEISLEALDSSGNTLAEIEADLADDNLTGETAEDAFMGFSDTLGEIAALRLIMKGGEGIEIDHVQWGSAVSATAPEPQSMAMLIMGLLGIIGFRRRNR